MLSASSDREAPDAGETEPGSRALSPARAKSEPRLCAADRTGNPVFATPGPPLASRKGRRGRSCAGHPAARPRQITFVGAGLGTARLAVRIMRNQFLAGIGKSNRLGAVLRSFAEADRSRAPDPREARLVLRDVGGALDRLPRKQRTAVLLAGVEGKSYDEVAQAMGLSVGAVRCHLARGRERLRAETNGAEDNAPRTRRPAPVPSPATAPSMAKAEAD